MRSDRGWRRFYATGWLVSAVITSLAFRQWRAYVREVEERADEAERTREEPARRRAVEERLRIARDLHDSLTPSISVVKVQAGVAAHLARKRGEEVPPALLVIQEASNDAARELRGTLDVLRQDEDSNGGSLDRLSTLVERARSVGAPTSVQVDGDPRALPSSIDQAAFRIVQESLTNVSRHAGRVAACVRLTYGHQALTIHVIDEGRRLERAPTPGLGLIRMRERVTALGGRLRAEPRATGGFSVLAELPLTEPP
ncbi:MAG: sensor histidine kinase [Nocardioidaceae bacterium]